MVAAAKAGADAVDVAIDSMSGITSQPSMGAVVSSLIGTPEDTQISLKAVSQINDYWNDVRGVYAPFECGQNHEMPGGQYTNLMYQSQQLGLNGQWPLVKQAYHDANELCGNIVKVTPSSKVVGDMANFMVQNKLSKIDVLQKADTLNFPTSVVNFFQGYLGIPEPWGFPEEIRKKVTKGKTLPNGKTILKGRPGAELPPFDFEDNKKMLAKKYGENRIRDEDVMSYALYPRVFEDWKEYEEKNGDVSKIPTRYFLQAMKYDEEIAVDMQEGHKLFIQYKGMSEVNKNGQRGHVPGERLDAHGADRRREGQPDHREEREDREGQQAADRLSHERRCGGGEGGAGQGSEGRRTHLRAERCQDGDDRVRAVQRHSEACGGEEGREAPDR